MKRLLLCFLLACGGGNGQPPSGPLPPRVRPGNLDATVLLTDVSSRAIKQGASPLSVVAAGAAIEGERTGAFVEIAESTCLLAYARASGSVEDIDVSAFSDEGNALAVDERPDPRPTIILCPPHPPRVFLAVHVVSGEGLVALGVHAVPRERASEVARSLGAKGAIQGAEARRPEVWPGLDDRVREHRSTIGGKWEDARKVGVAVDARAPAVVGLSVEADQCADVLVVPDEDVAMLEVEARDSEGRVIARGRESKQGSALVLCTPVAISGTLSVRPHLGTGVVAVVVGRAPASVSKEVSAPVDVAWTGATVPVDQAKLQRAGILSRAGYGNATSTATGNAAMGRRTTVAMDVTTPCSRIDVSGGSPLALVDVRAWDDAATLVGKTEGTMGAVLFACGRKKIHLEVEARGRPGPFVAEARKETWEHASFTTAPLAASRMLSRFVDGPPWIAPGTAHNARADNADAAHRASWEESIPQDKCAMVATGAEGEGTGLELRAIEVGSEDEIDRSHGDSSARVIACASSAGARKVRFEASVTSGKLTLVSGVRIR